MAVDGLLRYAMEAVGVPLLGLVAAGVLWVLGRHGRRVDDHPLCRRCGYDLFGAAAATAAVCPECGADVSGPRAVRVGHRERRRGLLIAALATALASGVSLAALAASAVRAWGDIVNRPAWWLVHELDAGSASGRGVAFDELERRLHREQLPDDATRRVADRVLTWQANPGIPWNPRWGHFVWGARQRRVLGDDQWTRYLRRVLKVMLETRARVRRGEPPGYVFSLVPDRFDGASGLTANYELAFRLDGLPLAGAEFKSSQPLRWGEFPWRMADLPAAPELAEGAHTLDVELRLSVADRATPAVGWRQSLTSTFRVVPADAPVAELVQTPDVLAQAEAGIAVQRVLDATPSHPLEVELKVKALPVDLAADVVVQSGGREWVARGATLRAGNSGYAIARVTAPGPVGAARADVIVRGSVRAAEWTADMKSVWGGELSFKDVPVVPAHMVLVPPLTLPVRPTTRPR